MRFVTKFFRRLLILVVIVMVAAALALFVGMVVGGVQSLRAGDWFNGVGLLFTALCFAVACVYELAGRRV